MPFSQETIEFLFQNRLEDSRIWFNEHKKEYQTLVLDPLRDLVTSLTPQMLEIDSRFVTEPRVDKTISRIWRDTRFTHDPSLYRDTMWIVFKRDRMHTTEYPGFYFEINCSGFDYGCGFYHASTSYMQSLRTLILENSKSFQAAQRAFQAQNVFQMQGDFYKRSHYPDEPEAVRQWLERRNIGFSAESEDMELLFSPGLADKLARDLVLLQPVYNLLLEAAILDQEKNRSGGYSSF